ncbi:hypothetical protein O3P69_017181 [Scylla paramamosain]|uniref:PCI domain-containing protein n=1 Tax=Scylla paramamosain TaxID=85552 RepID=A0AAW0TW66_SCYPA
MLECVYLVSAMLIEIPYMAAHEFDARRRMISKSFHHQLKNSERQSLVGPPESMREHVVAASKAMRNGNWKQCRNLLLNDKMNAKVWDLFHEADRVRKMLGGKIQEESLRTYLFTYSHVYDSISLVKLSDMFELPYSTVHAIISKMIINEEIMASLDEPTSCLVMHRTEPSSLQSLSLQLADKLYNLVENNERILDQKPFFTRGMQGGGYQTAETKTSTAVVTVTKRQRFIVWPRKGAYHKQSLECLSLDPYSKGDWGPHIQQLTTHPASYHLSLCLFDVLMEVRKESWMCGPHHSKVDLCNLQKN